MSKKPSPLVAVWEGLERLAKLTLDGRDYHAARLEALEERVRKLDGGDGAQAAKTSALRSVRNAREAAGKRAPEINLRGET